MPNACFVPGCKTGYKSQQVDYKLKGKRNPSIYKVPKDPAIFELWQRAIPRRTDRLLRPRDYVCSRHFKKEDLIYYNKPVKLFDGNVYLHMLEFPRLKKDAVPSIFPDTSGQSTYVSDTKPSKKMKCSKRRDQSVATSKQLKVQKAKEHNYGAEIAEIDNGCFTSKEKENVLKTDLSLLPSIILNCLTSEPHTVLSTLTKTNTNECQSLHSQSTENNNFSGESPTSNSQCQMEDIAAKENDSLKPSKLNSDIVSKVPDKVASFIEYLTSNMEIISFQPNKECDISDEPQSVFKSSEVTKDFSTSSQESLQLSSDSQSNPTNSEVPHEHSSTSNSSLDFRETFAQINHPNESTTKSYVTLQPLDPQDVLTSDPYIILNTLAKESKNFSQLKSIPTATEVVQDLPDTNVTEPTACPIESEIDVNIPLSTAKNQLPTEPTVCPVESEIEVNVPLSTAKNQFSFDFLKINAHKIDTMNSWWTVNTFDDAVIYARWSPDYLVDRKIIINEDLKIKVFLKEKEVIVENCLKATSIENISKLILKVGGLQLCGNFLEEERYCNGYYLQENFICKHRNLCVNCIKWEYERLREEKQLKKLMQLKKD